MNIVLLIGDQVVYLENIPRWQPDVKWVEGECLTEAHNLHQSGATPEPAIGDSRSNFATDGKPD